MSAFIVEDETINTIVNFLFLKQIGGDVYWSKYVLNDAGIKLDTQAARKAFALSLFDLNVQAVGERYDEIEEYVFSYRQTLSCNPTQAYKSLKCWLYQCTEGTVIESKLYKLMDEMSKEIAMYIVETSPAYNAAEWG
jgi:hypothetical protein